MIQAVCFDLDGTLYDDRQYIKAGLNEAAMYLKLETGKDLEDELKSIYFDESEYSKAFDILLERNNLSESYIPEMISAYHNNDADLSLYDNTLSTLEKLEQRYKLAIITDGKNGYEKICRLGIESFFDEIFVTADYSLSKKKSEPFKKVIDTLSVEADKTAYVGNHPIVDVHHPNQLGMTTIRIKTGIQSDKDFNKDVTPDLEINNICELPDVLQHINNE